MRREKYIMPADDDADDRMLFEEANGKIKIISSADGVQLMDMLLKVNSDCSQKDTVDKALEFGANLFLKKPDNFDTLKKILKKFLPVILIFRNLGLRLITF